MPRQLLISQARPRRIARPYLAFKKIPQKPDRVGIAIQRKAQIRRQLPHHIIVRIIPQHQQILFQSLCGLALLQKLLRALYAPP